MADRTSQPRFRIDLRREPGARKCARGLHLLHCAFDDVTYFEFAGDFLNALIGVLVGHRRGSRDDAASPIRAGASNR